MALAIVFAKDREQEEQGVLKVRKHYSPARSIFL